MATVRLWLIADVALYALGKRGPLAVEQENFRDAVLGRDKPIVMTSGGVHTFTVVEAVLTAADSGQTATLEHENIAE